MENTIQPSAVEIIKEKSNYLRGTLRESLADELTGSIAADDQQLIKLHGTYLQQDRDLDNERQRQKLEPLYSFLIRVRVPGGLSTANQWIELDKIAEKYGDSTLKLTTRQAFELHGVFKRNLKQTIKEINDTLLDTLAACGDVNRNVMSAANQYESAVHQEVYEHAKQISAHLTPQTKAYYEIWLDGKLAEGHQDEEPIYGKLYLPRKFKTALAIPPVNDVDVLTNDLGLIAIVENGKLAGYNVAVGGGMGMTFGNTATYPRLADVIGFCNKEDVIALAEAVVIVQRDNGNRSDRKNARLKYTIEKMGLENFVAEVKKIVGNKLKSTRPYQFSKTGDKYGWIYGTDKKWYYTLFVEGGKVQDTTKLKYKTALREIADLQISNFILTGNQNVIIGNLNDEGKEKVHEILEKYQLIQNEKNTALRLNSIACVALPLCGMAFADAERSLPGLIDKIDAILFKNNLQNEPIVIRMTGCPNGCGRPFAAEIGLVGKAPGKYNLYLGGGFAGQRLNKLYREMLSEDEIISALTPLLVEYGKQRNDGERFGDFVIRKGVIKPTLTGKKFHEDVDLTKGTDFQI